MNIQTLAARAGSDIELGVAKPLNPAIHQSSVYAYDSLEQLEGVFDKEQTGYVYYRNGHPNGTSLEHSLAQLEGAQACAVAASGMAAISGTLLAILKSGDHIVADQNAYGVTFALLTDELPRQGITTTWVNMQDLAAVERAIGDNTKVLFLESLSNPTIRVTDIAALAKLGKSRGLKVCVDNTFASPALIRPIEHGADLVFHSLAKYLDGHSSVMGGAVVGSQTLIDAARVALLRYGGTMAAFDAWNALNGIKTLSLRMAAHSQNALAVAQHLEKHPKISRVDYPGLESHPQFDLAKRLYLNGMGGMMSFEIHGGYAAASQFVAAISPRIPLAPSLADVSSTLSYPTGTSHRALTPEARANINITDGLLRLSVGIEAIEDILADLEFGLNAVTDGIASSWSQDAPSGETA
jgi:cystathionine gamma-synthase